MWWKFPYTNFHELNLDWILKKIKDFQNYLDSVDKTIEQDINDKVEELIDSGYFKDLVDAETLNGISNKVDNIISIKNIKIKNPGMNDDDLLDKALDEARSIGIGAVIVWDGAIATFNKKHDVYGISGIDFNNSTIRVPDNNITIINIIPDDFNGNEYYYGASNLNDGNIGDVKLFSKVFILNGSENLTFGIRNGLTENLYPRWCVVTDSKGNIVNGSIKSKYFPSTGTVKVENIHNYPKNRMIIKNFTVDYGNDKTKYCEFIRVLRSNTKIENMSVKGVLPKTTGYVGETIYIRGCCNVEVCNINGDNPVSTPNSGYIINTYTASNVRIHDMITGDNANGSWGDTASDWCTNYVVENCCVGRVDSHYAQWGEYTVRNCTVDFITYGVGDSNILIENCDFLQKGNNENCIGKRPDIGGMLEGNIVIRNCQSRFGKPKSFFTCTHGEKNASQTINISENIKGTISLENIITDADSLILFGGYEGGEVWLEYAVEIRNVCYTNNEGIMIATSAINNFWRIRECVITSCLIDCKQLLRGNIAELVCVGCRFVKPIFTQENSNVEADQGRGLMLIGCLFPGFVKQKLYLFSVIVTGCVINSGSNDNMNDIRDYNFSGNICPVNHYSFWNKTNMT